MTLFYSLLHDGLPRYDRPAISGLFGVTEAHHVIESLRKGAYDPGVVMCVPYAIVGGFLVAAVWREFKRDVASTNTTLATVQR